LKVILKVGRLANISGIARTAAKKDVLRSQSVEEAMNSQQWLIARAVARAAS
jgi:hypothetical protein